MFSVPFAALQQDDWFWITLIGISTSAAFITFWAERKRRAVWKTFARQNGLTYNVERACPRVSGRINGKSFFLELSSRSSDQGLFGIREVVMRLSIDTDVQCEFDITNEGVIMTTVREAGGDDRAEHINHDEFDRKTCLRTDDADSVRRFLTQPQRDAILALIHDCPSCDVHVAHNEIRVRERSTVKPLEAIEYRLNAMKIAASVIEPVGSSVSTKSEAS